MLFGSSRIVNCLVECMYVDSTTIPSTPFQNGLVSHCNMSYLLRLFSVLHATTQMHDERTRWKETEKHTKTKTAVAVLRTSYTLSRSLFKMFDGTIWLQNNKKNIRFEMRLRKQSLIVFAVAW